MPRGRTFPPMLKFSCLKEGGEEEDTFEIAEKKMEKEES